MGLVHSESFQQALDAAIEQRLQWQTSDELLDALRGLEAMLNGLAVNFPANTRTVTADFCTPANIDSLGWSDWSTKCRDAEFKQKIAEIDKLVADAGAFSSDGQQAATIAKKVGIAAYWKTLSDSLVPDVFVREARVGCSPLFNKNSQTVLKLTLMDRTPLFDQQAPTAQPKDNILVVQCGSRFSVTAGVALSAVPNAEFAIVKGTPETGSQAAVNRFDLLADPSVHPVPMAIAHFRLRESVNHIAGVHLSFGVGVNAPASRPGAPVPVSHRADSESGADVLRHDRRRRRQAHGSSRRLQPEGQGSERDHRGPGELVVHDEVGRRVHVHKAIARWPT